MRILVTRPEGQEQPLVSRLATQGHAVVHVPLIAIEPLGDAPIDVTSYDWVVLTSANAARELRRRLVGTPARVAAIGEATASAFGGADVIAEVSTQEGLLAALPAEPGRVLFAAAEGARTVIADALEADVLVLYRTIELEPSEPLAGELAVVTSPSAARALARSTTAIPVVSIGPETSRVGRAVGLDIVAEAQTQDVEGLVRAVGCAAGGA